MDTRPSTGRALALAVGALAAGALVGPVASRVALLIEGRVGPTAADLRGLLSDTAVALALVTVLLLTNRWRRWPGLVLVVAWCALNHGNYEHVTALGSVARWENAGYLLDATFVRGSVLAPKNPLLFLGVLAASCMLAWLGGRVATGRFALASVGAGAGAALALVVLRFWTPDNEILTWRQTHVVLDNLDRATRIDGRPLAEVAGAASPPVDGQVAQLFRADLSGEPIVELGNTGTNVLLILLEGISGAHLDTVSRHQNVSPAIRLPRLDRLARDHLSFRSFVSQQRQTNRGEYAVLCGDFPKLVNDEPKMTEVLDVEPPICLAGALRGAGYETAYLQAAPLGFMSKDRFMPRIGYSQVHGEEWFSRAYAANQWGIDDRAYFEQSLEMVRTLAAGDRPWFLTLLTVGTHHPYIVPPAWGENTFPAAAAYLDEAFERFLEGLRGLRVLDDTLVLITSDESVGISGYRGAKASTAAAEVDDLTKKLSDNWGFLIAMLPSSRSLQVDEPFMQSDLALSVLDYLGLTEGPELPPGRSVFRSYQRRRPVVFGNVYRRWLGVVTPAARLSVCPEDFTGCSSYDLPGGLTFSPRRTPREVDPTGVGILRALAERSSRVRNGHRLVDLLSRPLVRIRPAYGTQVVFGGQYLSIPAGARIDVELEVQALGGTGQVALGHLLKSEGRAYHFREQVPRLAAGELLTIRYSFTAPEAFRYLEAIAVAQRLSPGDITLDFKTARMTVSPPGGEPGAGEPGLQVHEVRVLQVGPAIDQAR